MKKLLSLFMIAALAVSIEAHSQAVIFSGSDVKTQKSTIDINGNAKILSGSADPSVSATSAPKGSIYLSTSTGLFYQKSDAGSSTNWLTVSIPDGSITAAKLATDAVETAKIKNLNVTTGKLADGAVTQAKREALNYQVSSSSGSFVTTSTSLVDVTNLTVTITTTGRPVFIGLQGDGTSNDSYISPTASGSGIAQYDVAFFEGATKIASYPMGIMISANYTINPPSWFNLTYQPSAGTYTYKVQTRKAGANTTNVTFNRVKLYAYEL